MKNTNTYFKAALAQAKKAFAANEVPVGCVIINRETGEIIARGYNKTEAGNNPLLHAEIVALTRAFKKIGGKNLTGFDVYLTLAPCIMCATALTYARVENVYYAAVDTKTGQGESEKCQEIFAIDKNLFKTKFQYVECEWSAKSADLLRAFFKAKRKTAIDRKSK